jgi:hypothetical protein
MCQISKQRTKGKRASSRTAIAFYKHMALSARNSCPDMLAITKHRPGSSGLLKTRTSCSALTDHMGGRESLCTLNAQPAQLHNRTPRPPPQPFSISAKRCILKIQHVTQQPPIEVNLMVENMDDRKDLVDKPLRDLGCSAVFSQVLSEVSSSSALLCKVENMRLSAANKHTPEVRRASISRSPIRHLLAKPEPAPAESISASLLDENPPSPVIRYLPGCGLTTIRRKQVVRLRAVCNQSRRSDSVACLTPACTCARVCPRCFGACTCVCVWQGTEP